MPYANRDGVRLCYTDQGAGGPPLLFVHGWCCDQTHWREQALVFCKAHRVVTVDLRGHGESDKPEQDYTMAAFCDDLAWMIAELDLRAPVVVGHSMGGLVALLLARCKRPELRAVVMVDATLHLAMAPEVVDALLQGVAGPDYRQTAQLLIDSFFRPTSPPALRAELTEAMLQTPQHVLSTALHSVAAEMRPVPLELGIPSLFIDAGRSFGELQQISDTVPGVEIARTAGAGHFNMIEAPEQVNAILRTFLSQLDLRR